MTAYGSEPAEAILLRADLVGHLVAAGTVRDERIAAAFRSVPRHLFVPQVALDVAYADDVVPTKRDEAGVVISSVSQPSIIAVMLEQAAIRPGDRVLEIGSGGYNAALLRELTGPEGGVTTVDIDPEVTARARAFLDEAGYHDVRVVQADGAFGASGDAPYDRIVVTVTAWEITPAWLDQLRPDGRIVVPLRLRGQTRSVAFDRVVDHLESREITLCGFVSMQGAGANYERRIPALDEKLCVSFDEDQEADAPPADGGPVVGAWSGVLADHEEPLLDLGLWLACTLPGYCVLYGEDRAVPRGSGAAVTVAGGLAYLTCRPFRRSTDVIELGVRGHGPRADELVAGMIAQVRIWAGKRRTGPGFQVHPLGAVPPDGFHIARRHSLITVSWAG